MWNNNRQFLITFSGKLVYERKWNSQSNNASQTDEGEKKFFFNLNLWVRNEMILCTSPYFPWMEIRLYSVNCWQYWENQQMRSLTTPTWKWTYILIHWNWTIHLHLINWRKKFCRKHGVQRRKKMQSLSRECTVEPVWHESKMVANVFPHDTSLNSYAAAFVFVTQFFNVDQKLAMHNITWLPIFFMPHTCIITLNFEINSI